MGNVYISMGSSLPAVTPVDAMQALQENPYEAPTVGKISLEKAQICPQNCATNLQITTDYLDDLQERFPDTRFRFHANVRLLDKPCGFDLASMGHFPEYRTALVPMLRELGEPYTIHAGSRRWKVPLWAQINRCKMLEHEAGVPVGIEGLYPNGQDSNTASTWEDYETILNADVRYALDLSHLNIVRNKQGEAPNGLIRTLLESPNCIEVHLSGNDGLADRHLPIEEKPFWWDEFQNATITADIFYEGKIEQGKLQ